MLQETFDYPELETHELLCNHLAPKLKGKPRGRRRKNRSDSPTSRIRCDSAGSDSADSEISACSVEKVYSKYSPLYVKPEFKQGKQVLATRPQLRYNPRPARTKHKSDSSTRSRRLQYRGASNSDSNSDSNDNSDTNTNTTNLDDDENESSEESEFVQKLIDFHEAHDSQIPKVFWVGLKRVNLLSIYQKVKKMGGYEQVTEQKMWKYLFGVDGGYNSISRKKYERALLPYEQYENRKQNANNGLMRRVRASGYDYKYDDESDSINSETKEEHDDLNDLHGDRRLTAAEITEIQRRIKYKDANSDKDSNVHVEMGSGSLPLTLIVGNQKSSMSPSHIQIQQPHTTITVHRTTIHPQTSARATPPNNQIQITNQIQIQQITLQPTASTSHKQENAPSLDQKYMYNIKQDANSYEVQIDPSNKYKRKSSMEDGSVFVANHLAKLGKATSLRHVRVKGDRSRDGKSGGMPFGHSTSPGSIGSVTVSAIKPNEKENIPYLAGSKTTTITPILGNSNKSMSRYPASISEIIDLVDSDNESSGSAPSPQSYLHQHSTMFPNMKKRKLEILRQGGLEVTAISNAGGPMNNQPVHARPSTGTSLNIPPVNVAKINNNNAKINASMMPGNVVPRPRFQSRCMYTKTSRIFGNPKDLMPLPAPKPTEFNCIDLSVEKCERPPPIELLRLPQSTTIQKAHSSSMPALTLPSAALAAQKITDPNLQITLVPPLTHSHLVHNSQHQNNSRKSENSKNHLAEKLSLPSSTRISANHSSTISNKIPTNATSPILNVPNLSTINENLKINQLLLQNFLNQGPNAAMASNSQASNQSAKDKNSSPPPASNPFLPMLDPMYLSNIYNNPNLFFPQTIPQELLQLYKNFPQGLGIIPISKS